MNYEEYRSKEQKLKADRVKALLVEARHLTDGLFEVEAFDDPTEELMMTYIRLQEKFVKLVFDKSDGQDVKAKEAAILIGLTTALGLLLLNRQRQHIERDKRK